MDQARAAPAQLPELRCLHGFPPSIRHAEGHSHHGAGGGALLLYHEVVVHMADGNAAGDVVDGAVAAPWLAGRLIIASPPSTALSSIVLPDLLRTV